MKTQITILMAITNLILFGCNRPDLETSNAWQKNMSEGIVPGYSHFVAHWVDSDIAVYIFSYKCRNSPGSAKALFAILQKQISDFDVEEQGDMTLVLRCSISYSGRGGFDEWRFIYDKGSTVMTVLFANLDSEAERTSHSYLIEKLKHYHDKEIGNTKEAEPNT